MSDTKNTIEIQKELDSFKTEHAALIQSHAVQESALSGLLSRNPQDAARINETRAELTLIEQKLVELTTKESEVAGALNVEGISLAAQRQNLISIVSTSLPTPTDGNLHMIPIHAAINPANLLDYMTFTQHLNPYGRKRQCDKDLENILAIIANDLGETFKTYKEAAKSIEPHEIY